MFSNMKVVGHLPIPTYFSNVPPKTTDTAAPNKREKREKKRWNVRNEGERERKKERKK